MLPQSVRSRTIPGMVWHLGYFIARPLIYHLWRHRRLVPLESYSSLSREFLSEIRQKGTSIPYWTSRYCAITINFIHDRQNNNSQLVHLLLDANTYSFLWAYTYYWVRTILHLCSTNYSYNSSANMNLPNEVTILILSFMPKSVVKQARLACQLWAELSAQFLFDTIYISPRRIDMDVFEKITRHKTLRNIPRHSVYDSAVFEQLDRMAYASYIHWQYHEGLFDVLGDAFFSVQEMIRYVPIEIIDESATEVDVQLKNHPVFDEGFWEYLKNANEFGNIFKPHWFRPVSRSLKRLGPIESVMICVTLGK